MSIKISYKRNYFDHKGEIKREKKSHWKSLLITGSTPADSSCAHFEYDIQ